ncbi:MAG: hypothetical protein WDN72_03810 [Alphaproteobacteria bacterium]
MAISGVSAGQYYNLPPSPLSAETGTGQVVRQKDSPTGAPVHHHHHHANDATSASNGTDSLFTAGDNSKSAIGDPSSALQASFAGGQHPKHGTTAAEDGSLLDLFA